MNLQFTQKIGGKPTNFVEKIWMGLIMFTDMATHIGTSKYIKACGDRDLLWSPHNEITAKIHTIREDNRDRWKTNSWINMVLDPGFQFAPLMPVTNIQKIEIDNIFGDKHGVRIDGRKLDEEEIRNLALNDGFDNLEDFWHFFEGHDFKGKLIHWTNFKY